MTGPPALRPANTTADTKVFDDFAVPTFITSFERAAPPFAADDYGLASRRADDCRRRRLRCRHELPLMLPALPS